MGSFIFFTLSKAGYTEDVSVYQELVLLCQDIGRSTNNLMAAGGGHTFTQPLLFTNRDTANCAS